MDAAGPTIASWGLVVGLCALPAVGETSEGSTLQMRAPLRVSRVQSEPHVTRLQLDITAYEQLKSAEQVVFTDFAMERSYNVNLVLRRRTILSDDAQIVVGTPDGDVPMPRPDVVLLGGHVAGHPDSSVFLGLSPHGTNGFIDLAGNTFIISTGPGPRSNHVLLYNAREFPTRPRDWSEAGCKATEARTLRLSLPQGTEIAAQRTEPERQEGEVWVVRLAIETDWEFTAQLGGDPEVSGAYALSLVAAVSEIYEQSLYTGLEISYLRLWSENNDPYWGATSEYPWYVFRNHWVENMGHIERDLAHWLSGYSEPGGLVGMGKLETICSMEWGYVWSDVDGYFSYPLQDNHEGNHDLFIVAHELGHNFGGRHTHELDPPADGCGLGDCTDAANGTILSYCTMCPGGLQNIALRFHERVVDETIIPHLSTRDCVVSSGPPLVWVNPADQTVCSGAIMTMRVGSSGDAPLTFQWRKDGQDLPGATTRTLSIDPVTHADAGEYDVVLTNGLGSTVTIPATLTIVDCKPPLLGPAGCRHLTITPQSGSSEARVALRVSLPDHPCIEPRYVRFDGSLVVVPHVEHNELIETPPTQTVGGWGTVYAFDHDIVPGVTYTVQADYGPGGDPRLTDPVSITTSPSWGDIVGDFSGTKWTPANGVTDFVDIAANVEAFRHLPTAPEVGRCDIFPAHPDGVIDFLDISSTVDGFRGMPYPFDGPECP